MSALRTLLTGLVDYAGLFPPAELPLAQAVENYASYRRGPHAWMLGRFVLPVSLLTEFAAVSKGVVPAAGEPWWLAGLINATSLRADVNAAAEFNERHDIGAVVDTFELKGADPELVAEAAKILPRGAALYVEVPLERDPAPLLDAIAAHNVRAKARTGGVTAESIPSSAHVVRFLNGCAERGIVYKCTAGLHHPIRARYRLTYAPDAPSGLMHGYVNVFLAGAYLLHGMPEAEAIALLDETELKNIQFTDQGVTWRGHRLHAEQLGAARIYATSFGSCSFEEPVGDLQQAGVLK
ncbi:MAG TPA: hypothetical protein VG712_07495 [Gemmatimonadales bacterium]|nr:hypothetical protein [Gemmatimonadales bacterium]